MVPVSSPAYSPSVADGLRKWAEAQRDLARALGLSLDDWLTALDAAGRNRAGLTAAVIGASVARGRGIPKLNEVDGPALATFARELIDPASPSYEASGSRRGDPSRRRAHDR